jgi:hypothetical protein
VIQTRRAVVGTALSTAALATLSGAATATATATAPIILDDASYQNPTPVARHIIMGPDHDSVFLAEARLPGNPPNTGAPPSKPMNRLVNR